MTENVIRLVYELFYKEITPMKLIMDTYSVMLKKATSMKLVILGKTQLLN